MKQTPVKVAPLALLLTVISICLTILAIISFSTAGADMRLTERYAKTVSERYALEVMGQQSLKELHESLAGGVLPEGFEEEEGVLRKTVELDGAKLRIGVVLEGGTDYRVVEWKQEREWTQQSGIGGLWSGN